MTKATKIAVFIWVFAPWIGSIGSILLYGKLGFTTSATVTFMIYPILTWVGLTVAYLEGTKERNNGTDS